MNDKNKPLAWCSQHQCHPHECFYQHQPPVDSVPIESQEEHDLRVQTIHLQKQRKNAG